MRVDKTQIGWTFPSARMSRTDQEARLRAAGAQHIVALGDGGTWRDAVRLLRAGDHVYIVAAVMLPASRRQDRIPATAQLGAALAQIAGNGAILHEVYTGRSTADPDEAEAILAEGVNGLRGGGRAMPRGVRGPGRPSRDGDYTAEQIERARRAWADTYSYQTIDVALAHMPAGWTARMARDRWGPRPKRRKRKK